MLHILKQNSQTFVQTDFLKVVFLRFQTLRLLVGGNEAGKMLKKKDDWSQAAGGCGYLGPNLGRWNRSPM